MHAVGLLAKLAFRASLPIKRAAGAFDSAAKMLRVPPLLGVLVCLFVLVFFDCSGFFELAQAEGK